MKPFLCRAVFLACAVAGVFAPARSFSQSSIQLESAIASGGKNASGPLSVESTIAEPIVASSSGGTFNVDVGFLALAESAQPSNLTLVSVVSRKTHGSQTFDVDLTSGNGIECRGGGTNNAYTLVFTFSAPINSCGTPSSGSVSVGPDGTECIVELTNVPDGHYTTVQLSGVTDASSHVANFSGTMGLLIGDTNADTFVDSGDIAQTKSQSGIPVSHSNFREDLNADDFVDSGDIAYVKSRSGHNLTSASSSASSVSGTTTTTKLKPRRVLRSPQKETRAKSNQG